MTATVAKMTTKELQKMISAVVEEKLVELLGDLDQGLEIKKSLRNRLLRLKKESRSWSARRKVGRCR